MHRSWMLTGLAMVALSLPAAAQVYRCQDAAGKTLYADAPCARGQQGQLIEPLRSPQEIQQERLQAAEAIERQRRQRDQERPVVPAPPAPMPPMAPPDKSSSDECRQALDEQATVSSIRSGTAEERRNRINAATQTVNAACGLHIEMIQPPPTVIVAPRAIPGRARPSECLIGSCLDPSDGAHRRPGPSVRTCQRSGIPWPCE